MKRLHESKLFYFSLNGGNVRIWFTTVPKAVKRYEVEPRENGRKIPNVMVYWDFREGDKLHIYLADGSRNFVARNGKIIEEKEEDTMSSYELDFTDCPEDELKHIFGLYPAQEAEREQENAEMQTLLDMCRRADE